MHETYSKRAMGRDVIRVMEKLGHVRFALAGHDRGARVAYRLALDEPGRVERLALLDIVPTFANWQRIREGQADAPHWDYLARPFPQPETEIGRDPLAYFDGLLAKWSKDGTLEAFDPRALAAYRQSCNEPSRIHAFCEDYRAGATVDLRQDEADLAAGRTITCPVLVVVAQFYLTRGARGDAAAPLAVWRRELRAASRRRRGRRDFRRRGSAGGDACGAASLPRSTAAVSAAADRQATYSGTKPVPENLAFDTARLAAWLEPRIESYEGPLEARSSRAGSRTRPIC